MAITMALTMDLSILKDINTDEHIRMCKDLVFVLIYGHKSHAPIEVFRWTLITTKT